MKDVLSHNNNGKFHKYTEQNLQWIHNDEFKFNIKLTKEQFTSQVNWMMKRIEYLNNDPNLKEQDEKMMILTDDEEEKKKTDLQSEVIYLKQIDKNIKVKLDRKSIWKYLIILNNAVVTGCNFSRMGYYFGMTRQTIKKYFDKAIALVHRYYNTWWTTKEYWTPERIAQNILPELKILFPKKLSNIVLLSK